MWKVFFRESKQKRERIIALDLLRGTFLVAIFINHIAWQPTYFDVITGRSHLFASAAEGFFVISGVLVGYIYGPRVLSKTKQTFAHLLQRAGWLYLLAVGFSFLYALITVVLSLHIMREQPLLPSSLYTFITSTLTLQYQYGWADFLGRYAVMMVIAPFAIWFVAKRLWWLVALVSVAVWAFIGPHFQDNFTAWQIVFVGGIILGYYLPQIEQFAKSLSKTTRRRLTIALFTASITTFILSTTLTIILPTIVGNSDLSLLLSASQREFILHLIDFRTLLDISIFDKTTLGVGRLVVGILWFASLYIVYRRYEKQIDKLTKGTLLILGTNSLFVYGLESFVLFCMDIWLKPPEGTTTLLKTVVAASAVVFIYLITARRTQIRHLRKRALRV